LLTNVIITIAYKIKSQTESLSIADIKSVYRSPVS